MKKSNFTRKNDLEFYLIESYFNVVGFVELSEDPLCVNLIEPLLFFNLLWQYHFTILFNKANPLKILKRLRAVNLNLPQRCYLFRKLLLTFNDVYFFSKNENHNDPKLISCLELIKCDRDKLIKELYPNETIHDYIFEFEYVKKNLAFITPYEEQKSYLNSTIQEYQQCDNPYVKDDHSSAAYHVPFDKKCSLLLEFIEKLHNENQLAEPYDSAITPVNLKKIVTRKSIDERFCSVDFNLKWKCFFKSEADHNLSLDILADYFIEQKVTDDLDIQLQERCKTRFCSELNAIYHESCPRTLKNNKDFYKVLRNFSFFKNKSNIIIYNELKR